MRRHARGADGSRARVRDGPRGRKHVPLRACAGGDGARDLPERAVKVHAADQVHDRQHLPRTHSGCAV